MLKKEMYMAAGDGCHPIVKIISEIRKAVKENAPLIHCITNPISIHDCANVVLAAGARPMMAEHPEEVAEITVTAGALALNLGNITDARKASILIAGKTAMEHDIPVIVDMVGIGCSRFRKNIIREFLDQRVKGARLILKGNMSELMALALEHHDVSGVDVAPEDILSKDHAEEGIRLAKGVAKKYHAVVLASGATDLVTDGEKVYMIHNGSEMMAKITGTGCMLNVLTAAYMSSGFILEGAVAACVVLGISGEIASERCSGTGSFQTEFLDALFSMTDTQIEEKIRGQVS